MMLTSSKPLRLALIGMSGAGKTYWTKHLSVEYPAISIDDRIETRLASKLQKGNFHGINGVAAWMGWPDSPTYAQREAQYLAEEIASMDEVLSDLEKDPGSGLILDTSGSVIHVGNNVLFRLRKVMTVVYLEASPAAQQLLVRRYLEDPKPVLWRGVFQVRAPESARETVARCYPALLDARRQSYETLAHHTLPVAELHELAAAAESRGQSVAAAFLDRLRLQIDGRGYVSSR
jgi:shikimate kinase